MFCIDETWKHQSQRMGHAWSWTKIFVLLIENLYILILLFIIKYFYHICMIGRLISLKWKVKKDISKIFGNNYPKTIVEL